MLTDEEVRSEGCICELESGYTNDLNWQRPIQGYTDGDANHG